PPGKQYELIVTCSVLHHVPDLPTFLAAVRNLQTAGGVFLHLQDPNGDFLDDPELRQRLARASQRPFTEWVRRFTPRRILGRISREMTGKQAQDYHSSTNRARKYNRHVATPRSVPGRYYLTGIQVQEGKRIPPFSVE